MRLEVCVHVAAQRGSKVKQGSTRQPWPAILHLEPSGVPLALQCCSPANPYPGGAPPPFYPQQSACPVSLTMPHTSVPPPAM